MASSSRDLKSRVTDVVTCPICRELCDSPKSLPCLHTFCLKCIEGHCRDNEPGDEVDCPMCRQKFKIPDNGVQGLVSNFFIADLVEARKTASDVVVPVPCEACSNDNVATSRIYCVDCNQKLCDQCSKPHTQMKGGPHKVVPIETDIEKDLIQVQGGMCEKHTNKCVELFCSDCKLNICFLCFAEEHKQHDTRNVDTVADEFYKQIEADMELVKKRTDGARNEISRLEKEGRKFLASIEEVSEKIVKRGEELKQLIDRQVNELMAEVQVLKTEKYKEIESHKENVETKLLTFETFSAYCCELKSKGKPCDITRAANDLHTRAAELLQNDVTLTEYCAPAVMFGPTNIRGQLADGENIVGAIACRDMTVALVVHTLPDAEPVSGVTSLDDELYVLRPKHEVDVYNATTTTTTTTYYNWLFQPLTKTINSYSLIRHLSVPALTGVVDMTSCKHYRCLYVADHTSKCVHRVELNGKVSKWSVNYEPYCLSVTSQFTVIVTCRVDSKLLELTTEGKQLREINLQSDIVNPHHAIQLSNGQFVVSHGQVNDPVHRVCIVDTNGHVTQSYGGPRGSATVGQLDVPFHLAVDKDEFIFVVDYNNRRVLLLSPTLSLVREIVTRDQFKWKPRKLCLDVDRRRLYIAESECKDEKWTTGRVVVVQL